VDADGDIDVISASFEDDKIAWYENDGNENFTTHSITNSADGVLFVYAIDVDNDGDMDVLSATYNDNKITWYENDGNENFTQHNITTSSIGARSVYAVDMDTDGDIDVLSASQDDNKIVWYENDGSENFTPHTITTSANLAYSVYAADIEGDGDIDVLSASVGDNKITWYENLLIVSVKDEQIDLPQYFSLNQNFPNPFNPSTKISWQVPVGNWQALNVYDVLGNEVATLVDEYKPAGNYEVEWDASGSTSGVYFYQLKAEGSIETKKMILMK